MKTATLTIVFTDIKGFTERTSRSTREENETLLATHSRILAPVFKAFGGKVIKEIGDAFLVTFTSPTMAVLAGTAIQDRLWEHNQTEEEKDRIEVRVAMNIGEVRVQGGDVFGEPVNIAARVEGIAEAGEVWFTEGVYFAMNKAEVPAEEVGSYELKGIPGKIKLYRVPKAPYRVESAETGSSGDVSPVDEPTDLAPPYANLGLSKMPDDPTARALAATGDIAQKAATAASRAMAKSESLLREGSARADLGKLRPLHALLALFIVIAAGWALWPSAAQRAISAAADAPKTEARQRAREARQIIDQEEDEGARELLIGQLAAALGNHDGAATHYRKAYASGESDAGDYLEEMLGDPSCQAREAALAAIRRGKITALKGAVEDLAEDGGPGDGEKSGLFFRCDSQKEAQGVLRKLGGN